MASPADMWAGDDFHHNGAFRLSYGFEYATMMESGKKDVNTVAGLAKLLPMQPAADLNAAREKLMDQHVGFYYMWK